MREQVISFPVMMVNDEENEVERGYYGYYESIPPMACDGPSLAVTGASGD